MPAAAMLPKPSVALADALTRLLPVASQARHDEASAEPADEPEWQRIPLFVLEPLLPGQRMQLHVFEPRYITMVRRANFQESKQFGMVCMNANGEPASHGSTVRIEALKELANGRFLITVRAERRFKILRSYELDGYVVAQAVWETDAPVAEEEEAVGSSLAAEVRALADEWLAEVRGGWEQHFGQMDRILAALGKPDQLEIAGAPDGEKLHPFERLGLWATALVNPLPPLGVAQELRLQALLCTDSVERLRLVHHALQQSLLFMRKNSNGFFGFGRVGEALGLPRGVSRSTRRLLFLLVFVTVSIASSIKPDLVPWGQGYSSFSLVLCIILWLMVH